MNNFKEFVISQLFKLYLKYLRYNSGAITQNSEDKCDFESQVSEYNTD
jgi:hypothetical protein